MTDISISELAVHVSEIIKSVRQQGRQYLITYHRRPVAMLGPLRIPEKAKPSGKDKNAWHRLKALGKDINSTSQPIQEHSIVSSSGPLRAQYGRVTVDAKFFLNAFNPLGNNHAEFHRLFEFFHEVATSLICPTIVLVELADLVIQKTSNAALAQEFVAGVQQISQLTLVEVDIDLIQDAVAITEHSDLCGNEAIYAAVAQQYSTTLITTKKHMRFSSLADFVARYPFEALEDLGISL